MPAFGSSGVALAGTGNSLLVAYPLGIQAGDLLILHALRRDNGEVNIPAGWSQHATNGARNQSVGLRSEWFWKRATGLEVGTLTVSRAAATTLFFARMYRFTGTPDGTDEPFEAMAQSGVSSNTITPADIALLGRDRLPLSLSAVADDKALGDPTRGTAPVSPTP